MNSIEQIMIDGVDVSRCIDFNKRDKVSCYHILYDKCNENPNCYFKQLACKTQECEQKDKELLSNEKIINKLMKEVDELRQECEELKKRATIAEDNFACEVQARLYHQNEWLKFSKECEELKTQISKIKEYVRHNMFDADCENWFEIFIYTFEDWKKSILENENKYKKECEKYKQALDDILEFIDREDWSILEHVDKGIKDIINEAKRTANNDR